MKFSLATCNVLYDMYYLHYQEPEHVFISVDIRARAFKQALYNKKALADLDILCFQEWPYKRFAVHARKNQYIYLNSKRIKKATYMEQYLDKQPLLFNKFLQEAYPPAKFFYLFDEETNRDGVLTIVNKRKFSIVDYEFYTFEKSKKMLVATLQCKAFNKKLLLINAHVPFFDTLNWVNKIQKEINRHKNIKTKIVCGDFNYDIYRPKTQQLSPTKLANLKKILKNLSISAELLPSPTALSGIGNRFKINDFIFYTKDLAAQNISIWPFESDINKTPLIKHKKQNPKIKKYFSDHAIVRMIFNR